MRKYIFFLVGQYAKIHGERPKNFQWLHTRNWETKARVLLNFSARER